MDIEKKYRSKKFMSTDSLWYEEERLNTFIDWPVPFIAPQELALNGFYYLRTKDHCACAFCLGIIGAWEHGDSICGEHKRHFPQCPFINGRPTPNVPLKHGDIIAKFNRKKALSCEKQQEDITPFVGEDVCGTTGVQFNKKNNFDPEDDESTNASLNSLGMPLYSGPKMTEYITYESRLSTYKDWPDKVAVTPKDLADAGFFYIGLSDHVRCFHCGNGLRNWEPNDNAWEEHARWYPKCNFILLKKGTEYIDKVTRTNPPYLHTPPNQPSVYYSKGAKYNKLALTDEELSRLMDLEVIRAATDIGLPQKAIKAALKKKLEQTGVPFFNMDHCVEAVFQVTEEELKAVRDESLSNQASKIDYYECWNAVNNKTEGDIEGIPQETEDFQAVLPSREESYQLDRPPVFPLRSDDQLTLVTTEPVDSTVETVAPEMAEEAIPTPSEDSPPAVALADESGTASSVAISSTVNASETEPPTELAEEAIPEDISSTSEDTPPEIAADNESGGETSVTVQETVRVEGTENTVALESVKKDDLLAEADEIIKAAKDLLGKNSLSSSGHSSLESLTQTEERSTKIMDNSVNANELSQELERIKEVRTCRVCMDSEMEIVFLPCSHMTACASCAVILSRCPICRGDIKFAIKPIIS